MAIMSTAVDTTELSIDKLHDIAVKVGGDTDLIGVSATGAADAITGLSKAGLSATEIFGNYNGYLEGTAELSGALRAAIDLAAASELDIVQSAGRVRLPDYHRGCLHSFHPWTAIGTSPWPRADPEGVEGNVACSSAGSTSFRSGDPICCYCVC
jgi:hypothetical protein